MNKNEKMIRRVDRTAKVIKFAANFIIPIAVGAVTQAATQHVMPSAPKIDTKIGKASFKVGEYFLIAFLAHRTARYVEEKIDEVAEDFKEGYEAIVDIIQDNTDEVTETEYSETVPYDITSSDDLDVQLTPEEEAEIIDTLTDPDTLVNFMPEHLKAEYEMLPEEGKQDVLRQIKMSIKKEREGDETSVLQS